MILIALTSNLNLACAEEININSDSSILIDSLTGSILFNKNQDKKIFPASVTKIMTALLVLEKNHDLNKKIIMSHEAIYNLEPGSSHIAMNEGESLTLEQALYALLIASANEVANALAEYISGSKKNFARLMNQRAHELGCENTNFVNSHGFHDSEHYTTCHDLALIMQEAVKHEEFIKIISTKRFDIAPTEKQKETRVLYNTNKMIMQTKFFDARVIGGKTGYTDEAGHTLVSYAKKNNINLICVIAQAENFDAYLDTQKLLDFGFEKFHEIKININNFFQKNLRVVQRYENKFFKIDTVNIIPERDFDLMLPENIKAQDLKLKENLPDNILAPVDKEIYVGELEIIYQDKILDRIKLFPEESIRKINSEILSKRIFSENSKIILNKALIFFLNMILCSAGILFLLYIIRLSNLRKKNKFR